MSVQRFAVVVAFAALFGACDADLNPNSPTPGIVSAPFSTAASSCSALSGSFRSSSVRITGLEPGLFRDFGASGADLALSFSNGLFTLNFVQAGLSPLNQRGFFFTTPGDLLTLALANQPLLPGVFPGDQRFFCQLFDNRLFLTSSTILFDFTGTGFVRSRFEGDFRRFQG